MSQDLTPYYACDHLPMDWYLTCGIFARVHLWFPPPCRRSPSVTQGVRDSIQSLSSTGYGLISTEATTPHEYIWVIEFKYVGPPIRLNKRAVDDSWVTGQRAWDPPEPIPNSEVKPRSVCGISDVFGFVKPRKLAAHFSQSNRKGWGLVPVVSSPVSLK